jgi:3-oxoacyl-[acyl-carrier protein] reductase
MLVGQTMAGRAGAVDDVAGAVAYLASPEASFLCGHVMHVNGGSLFGR